MPHSAIASGCIDFVLDPKGIAKELTRIGRHPYVMGPALAKREESAVASGSDLEKLLRQLRAATGVDFGFYKPSTLQRRIKRRLVLHHLQNVKEYLRYVEKNPGELGELYRDILIHVTGFFRDNDAFEALKKEVFPNLIKDRKLDESPIRVWIPGCSTGEEVYSVAISLLEFMWESARKESWGVIANKALQIFATDISESALDVARGGLYSESTVADVSPERLTRFFVKIDGGYQINKSIRDMCIFARQDVTRDPPFSNVDLISCRNVLIYLGPVLQKRVIPTFHYALKPNGFLMLGASESLGTFSDHFNLINKKYKIYQKKEGAARLVTLFTGGERSPHRLQEQRPQRSKPAALTMDKEVERILLNRYAPASVIVNKDMEIVQFRGRTGDYLEPPSGQPTFSLSKMAREGLLVDLRAAITRARKENTLVRAEGVHVRFNGGMKEVNLEVLPIQASGTNERFYMVVFEKASSSRVAPEKGGKKAKQMAGAAAGEIERLRRDLMQAREQFQLLMEDHETTTEEYRSANEEVLSANEELQSTNEELETAKEELQSSNEELTTLNEELQNRNMELAQTNNDLVNLLSNVNMPIIMVGNDLRIRRFTPPAQSLLNLIPADIGRRLDDLKSNLEVDDLERVVRETVYDAVLREQEVKQKNGLWYLMRVRPYKTWDNKIDGAVISFQDIDSFKQKVRQTTTLVDALVESARESVLILDQDLRVTLANPAFYKTFQVPREETQGRFLYELGNGQWDIGKLRAQLRRVTEENTRLDNFEVKHDFPNIGARTVLLNAHAIAFNPGEKLILLSIEDVTEQGKQLEELKRQATMLDMARDSVILRDLKGNILSWNRGAEEMYGWRSDEAVAKNTADLLHTVFPKPYKEIQAELQKTGHWEGELVHKRRDGQDIVVSSRWALLEQDGGRPIALEINTDITQRKRSEDSLRRLSGYLMRVQDEERRRIARELHDSTGQKLVALKMNLDMLTKGDAKGANKKMVRESVKLVEEAAREIRTLAQLLHPPLLDEAGLISATRWLVEGFSTRAGITVDLAVDPKIGRLPQNVEVALFRIIQESLNNIHRHSGAKKARIELRHSDGDIKLKISDDGKGFSGEVRGNGGDDAEKPLPGVGILGMKERLAQLGGTLTINSTREGTTIEAVVGNREQKASA
jgi:two-component system, chemotaxis family, CheB/CheR fusion protein